MGLFDSVYVSCPHCGANVECQTKADEDPYLRAFSLATATTAMLFDIMNKPVHCGACDRWLALVDPDFPIAPPRPNLIPAKVRTPDNPTTHPQGLKWWPADQPFTEADMMPTGGPVEVEG